jgi:hypothetical protein
VIVSIEDRAAFFVFVGPLCPASMGVGQFVPSSLECRDFRECEGITNVRTRHTNWKVERGRISRNVNESR